MSGFVPFSTLSQQIPSFLQVVKEIITQRLSFWQQDHQAETILDNSVEIEVTAGKHSCVVHWRTQGKILFIFQEAACQVCTIYVISWFEFKR